MLNPRNASPLLFQTLHSVFVSTSSHLAFGMGNHHLFPWKTIHHKKITTTISQSILVLNEYRKEICIKLY